jgi:hypothetical protein
VEFYQTSMFVFFVWQHFDQFGFRKYFLTLLPSLVPFAPSLRLCPKHYRVESTGWDDKVRCGPCREVFRDTTRPHTGCLASETCMCIICGRQPPSLFASASNVVFNLVFKLEQFELTHDVTYEQYIYVVGTKPCERLETLPPEFPIIQVEYRFVCCPLHNLHLN